MYTKYYSNFSAAWAIYAPDGQFICEVVHEGHADTLLNHLNMEQSNDTTT